MSTLVAYAVRSAMDEDRDELVADVVALFGTNGTTKAEKHLTDNLFVEEDVDIDGKRHLISTIEFEICMQYYETLDRVLRTAHGFQERVQACQLYLLHRRAGGGAGKRTQPADFSRYQTKEMNRRNDALELAMKNIQGSGFAVIERKEEAG